ncbi:MAG: gamma-glutamyltransferase [Pseudomonadota bacterium]
MRNLHAPGRSPAMATNGMAATSHALATQVAVDILKAGGNAMDAAIAACATQCVVEPGSTGIGGDCFALFAKEGKPDVVAYNGSGRAPAAASLAKLRELGVTKLERTSAHSVIIPGAVDAWCRLNADHGKMAMAEILQPAIDYARGGYPITQRVHFDFKGQEEHLRSDENLARIFLPGGKVPPMGSVHKNEGLADALEMIGREGQDCFYRGELAREMVETLQANGGLHTMDDFANAAGTYEKTITTEYRGNIIHECPPQGQGVIALLMLNVMKHMPADEPLLSVERIHRELELCRRGYAARSHYLADPAQVDVAVNELLSDDFARQIADAISMEKAVPVADEVKLQPHKDTVYISVVDKDRNCASFINTVFHGWGGGITTPKHNIVFTNRGQGFVLEEGHPNCIAPNKRPLHTIIPGMVERDGKITMSFGIMGGEYQAMGHLQFLTRVMDYGMDVQEAQDAPRWMVDPFTGEVEMENTVDAATVEKLRALGHVVEMAKVPVGGSQAIAIDWETGVLTGGSDPRKDGCAIGW